jgi:excisionase family DNA binding protein
MALDEWPELLTVTEAAEVLRISRTTAYAEAKRYLITGEGLPVIRVGRSLRAPRERLRRLIEGNTATTGDGEAA